MTFPADPAERQPKGDHNRRLSLGLDATQFAAEAGITEDELREYEGTSPDNKFSPMIAQRVGDALERLEQILPNSEAAGIQQVREGTDLRGQDREEDASLEQSIRDTAYYLWENDGRPEGRDQEYWHRARDTWMGEGRLNMEFAEALRDDEQSAIDRAVETARRISLQRPFNKDSDDHTSGGFNQKR